MTRLIFRASLLGTALIGLTTLTALADAPPAGYWDSFKISGHVEFGTTLNVDDPADRQNFGQLFTDKANEILLNQALITAERPLDPKATDYDYGFRVQAMYGSDARYTHFLGELDRSIHDRNQIDLVEANVQAHLPLIADGGIDLKLGQYATPIGYEVIDGSGNPFYSHSYIFNFGIPLKHTGGYAVAHVDDTLDLWIGGDTGVNTSIGRGDNNGSAAALLGFGLNNLLDGKLTILALTHIGAETPGNDSKLRYLSDVVATYKYSDALTLTSDVNFIRDDAAHAIAYGLAQYASYTLSDVVTLNGRAEVFRDNSGFFVGAFPGNLDFVNSERGFPAQIITAPPTTYGALTAGVTLKPALSGVLEGTTLRPELRWDTALNSSQPFDGGSSDSQITFAVDAVIPF